MAKKLVIVESPAKAKTINKILGDEFLVKASMGHIRDLPKKSLGVDFENHFKPEYEVAPDRAKIVKELQALAADATDVFLAPDPDREGEAIAWHLKALLEPKAKHAAFHRVTYNEITPRAVREAFAHPREIDINRVDAQQARRVLDRIVGYKVSPLLWRRIYRGLSAGRVQSVALRLVCERERAILAFVSESYWVMGAEVHKRVAPLDSFTVRLARIHGEKAEIKSVEQAATVRRELEASSLRVRGVTTREIQRRPYPPYITSTLQQAGSACFDFAPARTMKLAQQLYEGVNLGEGPVGLITYMRTDSVTVSQDAAAECRALISEQYGAAYLPEKPNVYRSRGSAQEAHEAIRPTSVLRTPDSLSSILSPDDLKLYTLIWQRFVASQMTPARIEQRTAEVETATPEGQTPAYLFRATASAVVFEGWTKVAEDAKAKRAKDREADKTEAAADGKDDEDDEVVRLPPLVAGEPLDLLKWLEERKETQPPSRFNEASLIKTLEENGVGRPSTYASILATLFGRKYILKEKRALVPTPVGLRVNDLLVGSLGKLFEVSFTAEMEKELDEVEEGGLSWTQMLEDFYAKFQVWMADAKGPPVDLDKLRVLIAALSQVKIWAPATRRGKRAYSDDGFVASVTKQMETGEKAMSDRQLEAMARLVVRYKEQIPDAEPALKKASLERLLTEPAAEPPSATTRRKIELLGGLQMEPPVKRRGRVYDDAAFFSSLRRRVESDRNLTPAQLGALNKIVIKYAERIPGFDAQRDALELGDAGAPAAPDPETEDWLRQLSAVTVWAPPAIKGRRTFDDKEFYTSLSHQYACKKSLSPRQKGALKAMINRYFKAAEAGETAEKPVEG
ncbi:MAG: type I DNA topoisomerase [bacterium]